VLALLCGTTSARAAGDALAELEAAQEALFARVAPSVVFITDGESLGSGFFVDTHGLILTAAHVVGSKHEVQVVLVDGRRLTGTVAALGRDHIDLALVHVPVEGSLPMALAPRMDLKVGAWVGSVGHGMGGVWAFTTGMISNIYPAAVGAPTFQTQIPINPGNSGGPIFDRTGRAVGIVVKGIKQSNSINFSIHTADAFMVFDQLLPACGCLVIDAPSGVPIFVGDRMVGQGPRVLLPAPVGEIAVSAVINGVRKEERVRYPKVTHLTLQAK
jgi:S1-C subfamily serine protease